MLINSILKIKYRLPDLINNIHLFGDSKRKKNHSFATYTTCKDKYSSGSKDRKSILSKWNYGKRGLGSHINFRQIRLKTDTTYNKYLLGKQSLKM